MEGFKYHFEKQNILSIWSTPNHCYRLGNPASVLFLDSNLNKKIIVFYSPNSIDHVFPTGTDYFL